MLKRFSAAQALALTIGFGMLCMLCLPSASYAQTVYGSIFGNVTDNTGAAIPNATIIVTDASKGTSVTVQSNAAGEYQALSLTPDTYNVKISYQGFESFETKGIVVHADAQAKVDAQLVVGGSSTTVEVDGNSIPVLKTESSDVSTTLTQADVSNLPVAGRNFTQLQLLLPGAQTLGWAHASDENPQGSAQIQVDGQAFGGVGFELDGTDNQDAILGIIVINPTLDSVSEVKIATQNFDAEFGKAVSSIVTSQTKSGTNSFHGSLFDYRTSNANLATNPYTQYPGSGAFPSGLKSLFGGSVGGPILKDKLFFFADYQGQRQVAGVSATTTIPTKLLADSCVTAASTGVGGCDFSQYNGAGGSGNGIPYQNVTDPITGKVTSTEYPNDIIPISQLSPQWLATIKLLQPYSDKTVTPQGGGSLNGIQNNYNTSGSGPFNNNAWNERVDYTLSEKIHIFERFSRFTDSLIGGQIFGSLGGNGIGYNNYGGISTGANDSFAGGADIAISSTLLTDFRLGYYRYDIVDTKVDQTATPATTLLGIPGLNNDFPGTGGLPDFNVSAPGSGGNNFGDGLNVSRCNCPLIEKEDQFQIVNNWTKIIKTHSIKIGADLRYARNLRVPSDANRTGILNFTDGPTSNPSLSNSGGNGWATFALGQVPSFNRYVSTSTNAKEFQKRDFFYIQDTWRATPNLTLNLGVRYEVYFPEVVNGKANGALMEYNHGTTDGYLRVAGIGNVKSDMNWSPSKFPFNPRIGVQYQLDPKTVIRSGYGRSFDIGVFGSLFGHVVTQNLPVLANQQISSSTATGYEFCLGPSQPNCTPAAGQPASGGPAANVFPSVPSNGLLPAPGFNVGIKARPNDVRLPTVDAWNLSVQRAVTPTLSITAAYVGNKGTHTLSAGDGNSTGPDEAAIFLPAEYSVIGTPLHYDPKPNVQPGTPGAPYGIGVDGGTNSGTLLTRYYGGSLPACNDASYKAQAAAAGVTLPANGGCGYANNNIGYYGNDQDSHFNALQVTLAKQYTKGLSGNIAYAWQKGIDFNGGYATWYKQAGKGRNNDIREQQVTMYGTYELPFGKKGQFATGVPTWADEIIGGWQISPVLTLGSGLPFTLGYNECSSGVGGSNAPCYPNGRSGFLKTHLTGLNTTTHSRTFYKAITTAPNGICGTGDYQGFTCPALDQIGNAGRNNKFGPNFFNTDLSLQKNFPIKESVFAQFRVDAFNAFNIVSAGNPGGGIESDGIINSGSGSSQFPGYAPGAQPRQLSFSLRVQF